MYKKYKCKLITFKHPSQSPKMVIKTKNKIIMHNEYKIFDFFFCLEIHGHTNRLWLDTNTDLGGISTNHNT